MVRLYIGGLAGDIVAQDLIERFKAFGKVQSADVLPPKTNDTFRDASQCTCRGYGYVEVDFTNQSARQRCLSVVRSLRNDGLLQQALCFWYLASILFARREERPPWQIYKFQDTQYAKASKAQNFRLSSD